MDRRSFFAAFPSTGLGSNAFFIFSVVLEGVGTPVRLSPTAIAREIGADPGSVCNTIKRMRKLRILIPSGPGDIINLSVSEWSPVGQQRPAMLTSDQSRIDATPMPLTPGQPSIDPTSRADCSRVNGPLIPGQEDCSQANAGSPPGSPSTEGNSQEEPSDFGPTHDESRDEAEAVSRELAMDRWAGSVGWAIANAPGGHPVLWLRTGDNPVDWRLVSPRGDLLDQSDTVGNDPESIRRLRNLVDSEVMPGRGLGRLAHVFAWRYPVALMEAAFRDAAGWARHPKGVITAFQRFHQEGGWEERPGEMRPMSPLRDTLLPKPRGNRKWSELTLEERKAEIRRKQELKEKAETNGRGAIA